MILIIGGARSGKSSLAVSLGKKFLGPVTFIATAQNLDEDMGARIQVHKFERPNWPTIEEPVALFETIKSVPLDHLLIIDCLTLWVANLQLDGLTDDQILTISKQVVEAICARQTPTIVVTNEVGLGIVPATETGRRYRDTLGRVNAIWTGAARNSFLLIAGKAIQLSDLEELEL
jgi:adenosylcobinamide kinase/adenosylcobinamide-phosphate guanylyltransferase